MRGFFDGQRRVRRIVLLLAVCAGLAGAGFAASGALASTGTAAMWSNKNSCLAEQGSSQSGSVTFTRTDKDLTMDVAMDSAGSYGVALFTITGGSCRSQPLGATSSDGSGEFDLKIKGSGHPITVELCVNVDGTFNFSDPVTLP
jgi:hypothetical protein